MTAPLLGPRFPVPYNALEMGQGGFYTFVIQFGLSSGGAAVMSAKRLDIGSVALCLFSRRAGKLAAKTETRPPGLKPQSILELYAAPKRRSSTVLRGLMSFPETLLYLSGGAFAA